MSARPCGIAADGVLTFNSLPVTSGRAETSSGFVAFSGLTVGPASHGLGPFEVTITSQTSGSNVITAARIVGN